MAKGLIINEDVWTLLEDYEPEEALELLKCLAAYHRGEDVPQISRYVKAAYQRIVLDNGRFDPIRRAELSAKRAEAGKKGGDTRWQNIAKIANDSKNSKLLQEEKRIEEIRIDKNKREERKAKSILFESEEVCAAWREYEEMRKKIKKPLLGQAESRAISKLESLSNGNPDMAVKVLNQSTDHCWVGLFEVKEDWKGKQNTSRNPRGEDYDKVAWDMFAKSAKEDKKVSYAAATTELFLRDLKGGQNGEEEAGRN